MTTRKQLLCGNCSENSIETYPLPHEYHTGKSFALFGWRIFIYRDKPDTIDDLCSICLVDRQQANERDRMEPALDMAYERGYEDGSRGKHVYL